MTMRSRRIRYILIVIFVYVLGYCHWLDVSSWLPDSTLFDTEIGKHLNEKIQNSWGIELNQIRHLISSGQFTQNPSPGLPGCRPTSSMDCLFCCENIGEVKLGDPLGRGTMKKGFMASHRDKSIVVKMVRYINDCIYASVQEEYKHNCWRMGHMHLMHEIAILQQLNHPHILKLLGFCIRSQESKIQTVTGNGMMAVFELGTPIEPSDTTKWSERQRLQYAYEIFDLFAYLAKSPLGSLVFPDLKLTHFMMVEGCIKVIDFDDVSSVDIQCSNKCDYGIRCDNGVCTGYNIIHNLHNVYTVFGDIFFPETMMEKIPKLRNIKESFRKLDISFEALRSFVQGELHSNNQLDGW